MGFPKQAMVLAAGQGTRLGDLGKRRAKTLVEIGGEPLLEHQLAYLEAHGVTRAAVNASHLAEQVEGFAEHYRGPIELRVVFEPEALGTAGGVRNALELFSSDPLLVLYGDVVSGENLRPLAAAHQGGDPAATLAVYWSDQVQGKGVAELSGSGVTAFHEKDPERTSGWVNAGIYIVDPDWIASFSEDAPLDFGFDLFPAALAAGRELRAHRLASPVLDIGTPADLAQARDAGLPEIPPEHPAK